MPPGSIRSPNSTPARAEHLPNISNSVSSLPTLHVNLPVPSSTQMGQDSISKGIIHSIDSNILPRGACASGQDSQDSNAMGSLRAGGMSRASSGRLESLHTHPQRKQHPHHQHQQHSRPKQQSRGAAVCVCLCLRVHVRVRVCVFVCVQH